MSDNSVLYFPLDCQQDDRITLIEQEFGLKGFAVLLKLFQKIFGAEGYYCNWTEEIGLLFSEEVCRLPKGNRLVFEVLFAAMKRGIFSQELFDKYGVLTSEEIQEKYFCVVGKRKKSVKMKKAYLLLACAKIPSNVVIEGDNSPCAPGSFEGKEREGKEKKRKTVCVEPDQTVSTQQAFITLILKDKTEYAIHQDMIAEWKKLYPSVDIEQELRSMCGWCEANASKRKTRRGVKKFINSRLARSQKERSSAGGQRPAAQGIANVGLSEEELERRRALIGGVCNADENTA